MYTHRGDPSPQFKVKKLFSTTKVRYDKMKDGDKVEICYSPRDPRDFAVRNEDTLACTPGIPAKMSVIFRWSLLPFILPLFLPVIAFIEFMNALVYSYTGQYGDGPGIKFILALMLAGTRFG